MAVRYPSVQYDAIRMAGGLDLVTPTFNLPPGVARDANNFECSISGGYTRVRGYQRFDGRPSPTSAGLTSVTLNAVGTGVVTGASLVGATSGASGIVCYISNNQVFVTQVTGSYTVGETVTVLGVPQGTITSTNFSNVQLRTLALATAAAADVYRANIAAVPGSGPIRGVAWLNNTVYAWRNNAGATALAMYKSSVSGWTAVSLGYELAFTAGNNVLLADGAVINNGAGATGTIARLIITSGTIGAGTAAGRLVLNATSGVWALGNTIYVGATAVATAGGASTAITLLPGGKIVIDKGSLGGGANATTKIYGADGVNRAFEWDGTTYVPIATGMATDAPTRVRIHKNMLFLAFGPSVQFSGLANPFSWSPLMGAGEIAMPESVTEMLVMPGNQSTGALAIFSANNTYILYGTSSANFQLVPYNVGTGAATNTGANMADAYVFNDRGVISLTATLNYGNFDSATLTLNIRPWIQVRRGLATDAMINREKSQYRVFFNDGSALYCTIVNGSFAGAMPVQYPNPVLCVAEATPSNGTETAYFGSDNGFVYEMDAGTSFDGSPISYALTLVPNSTRSPRVLKRYRKAALEVSGENYAEFSIAFDYGYSSSDIDQDNGQNYAVPFSSPVWDSVYWDLFSWDGRTLAPSETEMTGTAENVAMRLSGSSNAWASFTVNSMVTHYTNRRGLR